MRRTTDRHPGTRRHLHPLAGLSLGLALLGLGIAASPGQSQVPGRSIRTRAVPNGCFQIERQPAGAFYSVQPCKEPAPPQSLFAFNAANGEIVFLQDGSCLTSPLADPQGVVSTSVIARRCDDPAVPAANRAWTFDASGLIRRRASPGECLHWNAEPTRDGRIEVHPCSAGDPQVKTWTTLTSSATAASLVFTLRNRASGLCLGVRGVDSHGPGTGVEVFTCNPGGRDRGRDNRWRLRSAGPSGVQLVNVASGLCLGVRGADRHDRAAGAEVSPCQPVPGDPRRDGIWSLSRVQGVYKARNSVSGLCLDVPGVDSHRAGAPVEVFDCDPTSSDPAQDRLWELRPELG